jgi:hypothetical protein
MAGRRRAQRKKRRNVNIVDLFEKPTISPEELHETGAMPVGINGIYDALHSYLNSPESGTGIECFRVNRRIIIPTGPLRRKLGIVEQHKT